jgi:hypothetical protein
MKLEKLKFIVKIAMHVENSSFLSSKNPYILKRTNKLKHLQK